MNDTASREWLILNAIECWLYHFPDHGWTPEYKALADELRQEMKDAEAKAKSPRRSTTSTKQAKEQD